MDTDARSLLQSLVRETRTATLATLRGGAPNVSMVLYLPEDDFSSFHVRVSRLAWHTQDMQDDARVALSVQETDAPARDPQQLARLTVRGTATQLMNGGAQFERLKAAWLARYPDAGVTFELPDFAFWSIAPREARFVAGFARTFNLSPAALAKAAKA
ncbi:MAG: pyridoxamine 5'-phosphate oxidase family protein [Betaproteobacteria bacterium]|nr:pyridoxamine 5'-phosphate oxidase family protein [Betaproteobacteria bacterium]